MAGTSQYPAGVGTSVIRPSDARNRDACSCVPMTAGRFGASVARPLFTATMLQEGSGMFDVTADGQRFLVTKQAPDADTGRIALVLNWTAHLKR